MNSSDSGILGVAANQGEILETVHEHFRRTAAAKAGRGNAKKLRRLRDLAFKVYSDECDRSLQSLPAYQKRIADVSRRHELRNPLRPEYKLFFRRFLEASQNESWNELEGKWLKKLESAELTESTLYSWWKGFNKDLTLILNQSFYRDTNGDLVYDATSSK